MREVVEEPSQRGTGDWLRLILGGKLRRVDPQQVVQLIATALPVLHEVCAYERGQHLARVGRIEADQRGGDVHVEVPPGMQADHTEQVRAGRIQVAV